MDQQKYKPYPCRSHHQLSHLSYLQSDTTNQFVPISVSPHSQKMIDQSEQNAPKQTVFQQEQIFQQNYIEIHPNVFRKMQKRRLRDRLYFQKISFCKDQFYSHLLKNLDKKITRWNVQQLSFNHQKCTQRKAKQSMLLYKIIPIKFPYLQILCLRNSHIQSIEVLTRLQAPNLIEINLNGNRISCITALRKLSTNKLKKIQLWGNIIIPPQDLSQFNFPNLGSKGIISWSYKLSKQLVKCQLLAAHELRRNKQQIAQMSRLCRLTAKDEQFY